MGLLSQAEASSQLTGGQRAVTKQAQAGCVRRMGTAQQQSCPGQGSCRLGWAEERGPGSAVTTVTVGRAFPLPEAGQLMGPLVGRDRVEGKERRG